MTKSKIIADLFADALPTREEILVNVAICGWLAVFIRLAREGQLWKKVSSHVLDLRKLLSCLRTQGSSCNLPASHCTRAAAMGEPRCSGGPLWHGWTHTGSSAGHPGQCCRRTPLVKSQQGHGELCEGSPAEGLVSAPSKTFWGRLAHW